MFGIFNPSKVEISNFKGYQIYDDISKESKLGDSARFLNIMANRGGRLGACIGLYTDGSNAYFEELPHYRDEKNLNLLYEKIRKNNNKEEENMNLFADKNNTLISPGMPNKKTIIKAFMAKVLSITKQKKKYDITWGTHSLPDELDVDGYRLVPMVNLNGETCSRCWFSKVCPNSNIPCTPIVYWTPKTDENGETVDSIESDNKELNKTKNAAIGFQIGSGEKNDSESTTKRKKRKK